MMRYDSIGGWFTMHLGCFHINPIYQPHLPIVLTKFEPVVNAYPQQIKNRTTHSNIPVAYNTLKHTRDSNHWY